MFKIFQSTLPQGERRIRCGGSKTTRLFQSTLPQGERHFPPEYVPLDVPISIHAPARGATPWMIPAEQFAVISIHAPARGATRPHAVYSVHIQNFNPRSRKGSDDPRSYNDRSYYHFNPRSRKGSDTVADVGEMFSIISIHAPARGAT